MSIGKQDWWSQIFFGNSPLRTSAQKDFKKCTGKENSCVFDVVSRACRYQIYIDRRNWNRDADVLSHSVAISMLRCIRRNSDHDESPATARDAVRSTMCRKRGDLGMTCCCCAVLSGFTLPA